MMNETFMLHGRVMPMKGQLATLKWVTCLCDLKDMNGGGIGGIWRKRFSSVFRFLAALCPKGTAGYGAGVLV